MADGEESFDEALLQEAEELDTESSGDGDSTSPPPRKKRKLSKERSKSKKKSKRSEKEVEVDVGEELTPEQIAQDSARRKELRKLKLKHPNLDISQVLKVTEEINAMTPEDVINTLESSKVTIGQKRPLAEAENVVGLAALCIQYYFKTGGDLYHRFISDDELIASVDEYVPRISDEITGPMGILRRAAGHILDSKHKQSNFSNVSSTQQ